MSDPLTKQVLDEVAKLVEQGGGFGGGSSRPTRTLFFKGPQTAGTLQQFRMEWSGFLTYASVGSTTALISRGRTWTSLGASTFHTYSVIGMPSNSNPWHGRERFENTDYIYIDSIGGLGTSDIVTMVFEID